MLEKRLRVQLSAADAYAQNLARTQAPVQARKFRKGNVVRMDSRTARATAKAEFARAPRAFGSDSWYAADADFHTLGSLWFPDDSRARRGAVSRPSPEDSHWWIVELGAGSDPRRLAFDLTRFRRSGEAMQTPSRSRPKTGRFSSDRCSEWITTQRSYTATGA